MERYTCITTAIKALKIKILLIIQKFFFKKSSSSMIVYAEWAVNFTQLKLSFFQDF
jgi:hypothetical protein